MIKSILKRVDGWANFFTGMGIGGQDKSLATIFCPEYRFGSNELDQMYRSDGITRRIIDTVPEEMIREGWEYENVPDDMLDVKFDELDINTVMTDLLRWARLYGGAIGVMGIADGRPLDQPVDMRNISRLNWIRVYDRHSISSANGTIERDLDSPNYGKPTSYLVTDSLTGNSFVVHSSRVIRAEWNQIIPRNNTQGDGFGDSIIQSIYTELKNYSVTFANCGIIIHDFVNTVLKIKGLANLLAGDGCGNEVQNRANILNMSKSSYRMMVLDSEESFEKLTTNVAGIPDLLDRFMLALSAVTAIPISLLFGRSPSGLNATGESDVRNFYDMIKQKQECKLRPMLNRVSEIIFLSKDDYFKGQEPKDWKLSFVPLWQNTEEEEVNIRRTVAETDAIYIDRGVLESDEVAVSRFGGSKYSINTEINTEERKELNNQLLENAEAEEVETELSDIPQQPESNE